MVNNIPNINKNWLRFWKENCGEKSSIIYSSEAITFNEIDRLCSQYCFKLVSENITQGDLIGIFAHHNLDFIVSLISLWNIGAIPVLLNENATERELNEQISELPIKKTISTKKAAEGYNAIAFDNLKSESYTSSHEYKANDTAVIIFTSGSTSKPKPVEISFGNIYHNALMFNNYFDVKETDKNIASLPLFHVGGFMTFARSLILGLTLVLPKSLQLDDLIEAININEVEFISLVPSQLIKLFELKLNFHAKIKYILLGGGPSSDLLISTAINKKLKIAKVYGATETCSFVSVNFNEGLAANPASGGMPLKNVQLKITDENGNEVEPDIIGRVLIKSPTIAKGYFSKEGTISIVGSNGFYDSGDFGFLDSAGYLFIKNRQSRKIVSGGENINPGEIEDELLKLDFVEDCFVTKKADEKWGEIAVAVLTGKKINDHELKQALKQNLSKYKIPKQYFWVNKIPRNALGKIQENLIRKIIGED